MSRSFARMVEKNKKQVNKKRQKYGQTPITTDNREAMRTFRGRSWALPLFLIAFIVYFVLVPGKYYQQDGHQDGWYWTTILLYVLLALFLFLRRPFLSIGKSIIRSRRFGGDRTVEAQDIDEISIAKGLIVIQLKQRKSKWMFSHSLQRYNMDEMAAAVKEFANRNGIPLKENYA